MSEIEERGIPMEGPEEEPEPEEEEEVRESRPLPPFVKLLILLVWVIVLAAGAFFVTQRVVLPQISRSTVGEKMTEVKQKLQKPKREERTDEESSKEEKPKRSRQKKKARGETYRQQITGITANTAGSMGRRFVAMDIMVEMSSEDSQKEIVDKEYQIRDALIFYFGGRTVQEISTRDFILTARDEVRDIINSIIESEPVDTVFFTTFLIQ